MSIFKSMCFIRPRSLRLHSVGAICESVCSSGAALYCHYCKSCAAPKPSNAPEPSELERARVFCVRVHVTLLLQVQLLRVSLSSRLASACGSGQSPWYTSPVPSKYLWAFELLLSSRCAECLDDDDCCTWLCQNMFWRFVLSLLSVVHRRRPVLCRWWLTLAFSIPCAVSIPWMRRGLPCNEYPVSSLWMFIANCLPSSPVSYKRTASCMFSSFRACFRKRSTFY